MGSEFKRHIKKYGIKPILARVKHPLTNGKIEKWFHTYQRFRKDFSSFEEFVDWYNNRPLESLNVDRLESPEIAFWRRMRQSNVFYWPSIVWVVIKCLRNLKKVKCKILLGCHEKLLVS